MSIAAIAVLLVLGIIVTAAIFWPFLEPLQSLRRPNAFFRDYEQLIYRKEILLENLKELELDRQLEKISPSDYEEFRSRLVEEAVEVYHLLETLEKTIEPQLAKLKKEWK